MSTDPRSAAARSTNQSTHQSTHRSAGRRWLFRLVVAALIGSAVVARQAAFARNSGRSPLNVPHSPSARDVVSAASP